MKPNLNNGICRLLVLIACFITMSLIQADSIGNLPGLGKGTMYLKGDHIIKNIRLMEVKSFWIVFKKDGNLHDKMMDEIFRIEFPEASPSPVIIQFEDKKLVIKKMYVELIRN